MKKLLCFIALILTFCCLLASCKKNPDQGNQNNDPPTSEHTHAFGEWVTVTEAGCTTEGLKERVCSCNEKESEVLPATGHNYTEGVCEVCGDISSEPTADEYFIFTELEDGTYSVAAKDVTNMPKVVVIPAEHNGKAVTMIEDYAFINLSEEIFCTDMTSVVIPEGVTLIGFGAFAYCSNLYSVEMPNSIISMSDFAFLKCSSLVSITIPSNVESIGDGAFSFCRSLVEVINKSSLSIVAGVELPGDLATHAKEVHSGESKIDNVNEYLFYTYGDVNYLLKYVGKDTDLVLPTNYNGQNYVIYPYAFSSCSSITSVTVPNNVTSIGDYAFDGCTSLTSVTIPDSVTSIGDYAFENCNSLTDVYYTGTEEEWAEIAIGSSNNYLTNANIHFNYVPEE